MFNSSRTKAQLFIDRDSKLWIDARASWIVNAFGKERICARPVVLPTIEFFPARFKETPEDARTLLELVCGFMDVDPNLVDLYFFSEAKVDGHGGALGLYHQEDGRFQIWIETNELNNPMAMTATMAHELAHARLLGEQRVFEEETDHEPLTDLTVVFLGLGVILANATLVSSHLSLGNWSHWSISRRGYLNMGHLGYALALYARMRREEFPHWMKHLREDMKDVFLRSQQWLVENGYPDIESPIAVTTKPTLSASSMDDVATQDVNKSEAESDDRTHTETFNTCRYCGERMDDSSEVCSECMASIEANTNELHDAMREEEADEKTAKKIMVYGGIFIFLLMLILMFVSSFSK